MGVSQKPGMGAIPYAGGVTFRVWAPNAQAVTVAGTFNNWGTLAPSLSPEGNGYWSADLPNVQVGDLYKFVIANPPTVTAPYIRTDPYARCIANPDMNGKVIDIGFVWTSNEFSTPAWNETVLYQLHVGSFLNDPEDPTARGTFNAVSTKLNYLVSLGVNAIQLLPVDEFPGQSSMGYNPAYQFAVEDEFGGPLSLQQLVDAAHNKGLAVFFDVVYNHLASSDLWRS